MRALFLSATLVLAWPQLAFAADDCPVVHPGVSIGKLRLQMSLTDMKKLFPIEEDGTSGTWWKHGEVRFSIDSQAKVTSIRHHTSCFKLPTGETIHTDEHGSIAALDHRLGCKRLDTLGGGGWVCPEMGLSILYQYDRESSVEVTPPILCKQQMKEACDRPSSLYPSKPKGHWYSEGVLHGDPGFSMADWTGDFDGDGVSDLLLHGVSVPRSAPRSWSPTQTPVTGGKSAGRFKRDGSALRSAPPSDRLSSSRPTAERNPLDKVIASVASPRYGPADLRTFFGGFAMHPPRIRSLSWFSATLGLCAAMAGCSPYDLYQGEYFAGSVDPKNFPAEYLGEGGDPVQSGGKFIPLQAHAHGQSVYYFSFPFSDAQLGASDPLALSTDEKAELRAPIAYIFDPGQPTPGCVPPAPNYVYNQQTDTVPLNQQNTVFTKLPDDPTGYFPVVAQVTVASMGEVCQSIKSEDELTSDSKIAVNLTPPDPTIPRSKPHGTPDAGPIYQALALIDPGAEVQLPNDSFDPTTGLGPQLFGWYNHYLPAYIDGGTLDVDPQLHEHLDMSGKTVTVQEVKTMRIFYPDTVVATNAQGNKSLKAGGLGTGYDVVDFKRGEMGYEPICQVFKFTPKDTANIETDASMIDPATITPDPNNPYIYCLEYAQ